MYPNHIGYTLASVGFYLGNILLSGELIFGNFLVLQKKKLTAMVHDGEIVGLYGTTNGRSCNQHECCGRAIEPGHVVRFKVQVQDVDYTVPGQVAPDVRRERVIKVMRVIDGTEMCHVGFLPKYLLARPNQLATLDSQFAQIIDLYSKIEDDPSAKKVSAIRNCSMASYRLLENVRGRVK